MFTVDDRWWMIVFCKGIKLNFECQVRANIVFKTKLHCATSSQRTTYKKTWISVSWSSFSPFSPSLHPKTENETNWEGEYDNVMEKEIKIVHVLWSYVVVAIKCNRKIEKSLFVLQYDTMVQMYLYVHSCTYNIYFCFLCRFCGLLLML